MGYLRVKVQSAGQPTLLIEGPEQPYCIVGDKESGVQPEMSGFWQAGRYAIYVGDLAGEQHPYTMTISAQQN